MRACVPSAVAAPGTASLAAPLRAREAPGTWWCHRGGHADCRAAGGLKGGVRDQDLALPLPESTLVAGRIHGCLDGYPAALDNRVDRFQSCGGTRRDEDHAAHDRNLHACVGHILFSLRRRCSSGHRLVVIEPTMYIGEEGRLRRCTRRLFVHIGLKLFLRSYAYQSSWFGSQSSTRQQLSDASIWCCRGTIVAHPQHAKALATFGRVQSITGH